MITIGEKLKINWKFGNDLFVSAYKLDIFAPKPEKQSFAKYENLWL